MIRDPFYRKIIQRLNGSLDGNSFEACAADLLRTAYPTLVPVPGGSDSGMDGAIGNDGFLVTTTARDVIGNLDKNLKSHLQDGDGRRKVMLVASHPLTPRRRKNLHQRASELGFNLLQIYDQAAMASLLYRDPNWCKELLNLAGDPAPLSVVPKSERPFVNLPLIGREADLAWLRQTKGDKLLVGQPGSGKTFLLRKLAVENGGLFVNTDDRGEIAEGIREQQPRILIVDDAQLQQELLLELKQLREELDASFAILASGWPGDEMTLAETLNLLEAQVHHLELLPRNDIVKIINATGIGGPNQLIRELVNQADGRPGLAVTLADLCLKGDVERVRLGDALSRSLLKNFASTVGERAIAILAAFSIGGDTGMRMQVIADELQLSLVDLREAVIRLAAGGVIFELDRERLAVRPPTLRDALVRDVFFRGVAPLPSERLLQQVPSVEQAALTLIGARWRGAVIPHGLLVNIIEQANSARVYREYASLGREETHWTLTKHPEKLIAITAPALHYLPEISIPRLLDAAIGDERQLNSTPEHPMRLIVDWVQSGVPGTGEPIRRRKAALDTACSWLKSGGDVKVGLAALTAALSPRFETTETDPGAGMSVNIRYGILAMEELCAVQKFWSKALDVLGQIEIDDWEPLRHLVTAWASPGHMGIVLPGNMYTLMRTFAGQLFRDVVAISNQHPEIAHWAKQTAEHLQVDVEIQLDRDFEILYPYREHGDWKEAEERQGAIVRELAHEWSHLDPEEIAQRINSIEGVARRAKVSWPRWTPFLCEQIASQVASPNSWAQAMAKTVKIGDLVLPFLRAAAARSEVGWVETANFCLDQPGLRGVGITVALMQPSPPEELLNKSLENLQGYAQMIEGSLCA